MLGNLKMAISGTDHAFKFGEYAPRYLANFPHRVNRRYNSRSLLRRLLRAKAPWPTRRLTLAATGA